MKEYLFAYGMFRDAARNLLGDLEHIERTTINAKIYRVNTFYPGAVLGDGITHGDLYLVDISKFPELDEFEGDEYIRKKTVTSSGVECWVYEYILPVTSFKEIKTGDWFTR